MADEKPGQLFGGKKEKPLFVVLEGTDGSGKTEQFKRLLARLAQNGITAATFDFPQYGKPSSYFVANYLNGKYGGWNEVGPRKASLFYAMDRFDVGSEIKKRLAGGVVVSNRYVASNMGHQGAKIEDRKERREFFRWDYELEYEILGIPRPDFNVILRVPAEIAQQLVDNKGRREYLGGVKRDIHEADINHLRAAERAYVEIADIFPDDFKLVECMEGGRLLSIDEVHEKVWRIVSRLLGA